MVRRLRATLRFSLDLRRRESSDASSGVLQIDRHFPPFSRQTFCLCSRCQRSPSFTTSFQTRSSPDSSFRRCRSNFPSHHRLGSFSIFPSSRRFLPNARSYSCWIQQRMGRPFCTETTRSIRTSRTISSTSERNPRLVQGRHASET